MIEEFIRCPRCDVGIIPVDGALPEHELPGPLCEPPKPGPSGGCGSKGMTLDQFRDWLGEQSANDD